MNVMASGNKGGTSTASLIIAIEEIPESSCISPEIPVIIIVMILIIVIARRKKPEPPMSEPKIGDDFQP